jgi:molecular chaperone GrpE
MSHKIKEVTNSKPGEACPMVAAEESSGTTPPPAEVSTVSPEQLAELQAKAAQADEYWDRLLRQTADFDNFKKRNARERQEAVKFANVALLEKLVLVLDNFEMGLAATNTSSEAGVTALQKGITMIISQFKGVLAEAGLEEIEATGKRFDPNLHEAVSEQESAEVPEGQVLQQVRKGYRLKERLIRPASVIVAKKSGV